MEDVNTDSEFEAPHNADYDLMKDHVFQDDHELLYLDTYLRDAFETED